MSFTPIPPFVPENDPFTQIVPFTYRDGRTYLRQLEELIKRLQDLISDVNKSNASLYNKVVEVANKLIVDVNKANAALKDYVDTRDVELRGYVDGEVEKLNASVEASVTQLTMFVNDTVAALEASVAETDAEMRAYVDREIEKIINQSLPVNDQIVSTLMKDAGTQTAKEVQTAITDRLVPYISTPEDFGAVGDGVSNDAPAIQAAIDVVTPGGIVMFKAGAVYRLDGPVILKTGVTIEGNGATVYKSATSIGHVVFANEMHTKGYGGGGRNIALRNLKVMGQYTTDGTYRDVTTSLMHVSGVTVENCVFEQGMVNGHYLDLLGCDNVRVSNTVFKGMNPISGREIIEAVQIDSATYSGAGHTHFGMDHFDGLPTRNVKVSGCTFTTLTVGGTEYGLPNPLGTHNGALIGTDGWYQDIWFENNEVRGWTPDVAGNFWQGWLHMPGFRNVVIQGNTFAYTGPSRGSGRGSIIVARPLGSVIPLSQVAVASPVKVDLSTPRGAENWLISNNVFVGFSENFSDSASATIYMDAETNNNISVIGNSIRDSKCRAILIHGDKNLVITGNTVTITGTQDAAVRVENTTSLIASNSINTTTAFGIYLTGGRYHVVEGNLLRGGTTGIRVNAVNNGIVANNFIRDYVLIGIEIGHSSDSSTSFDVTLSGNRLSSSVAGITACMRIGALATRTFRYGNRYRDGGPMQDNGVSTISTTALDTN